ncbi:MAG: helix-turn-helix transcriptional regulator [Oscillospiraceae bacterium]|nr:helix-turn-helix transcriptional regulator [Oscillospiraceae bacterium]
MELGKTIKRLRTEQNWSQETLAEKAYVSRQTVSNWETEKSYPDVHSLLILSDLFGVSLDELVKGDVEIMKNTVQNEDAKTLKRLHWLGIGSLFALMFGVTALVEYGGEVGRLLGCMLAGVLAVVIFLAFHKMEQFKEQNDIQTYREVLAFLHGETLDDIEKQQERAKRSTRKKLYIGVIVVAAAELLVAAGVLVVQLLQM